MIILYCFWQKYCHQHWKRKCFGQSAANFQTIMTPGAFRPSNLTGWTAPGRERVGIRAMLIQFGLRLLLGYVWSQDK